METYVGQIEIFGFNFAPYGWAFAAGQLVPIQQNSTLFSLIGTQFGGNGQTNFELPNMAARQACGAGTGPGLTPRTMGETFGMPSVSLTVSEIPAHNHGLNTYYPADTATMVEAPPMSGGLGGTFAGNFQAFAAPGALVTMNPMFLQPTGGNMPHNNLQPYLGLNFCIALQGNYPQFG